VIFLAAKEFKQIIAMISGTSSAQIVTLLFSPLLTRLYKPEHFGQVGVFLAITAVLIPIAALTLPMAIVLAKNTVEAKEVSLLSLVIAFASSLVFLVVIVFNIEFISQSLNINTDSDGYYLYWVPVAVFLAAMLQIADNWVIRMQLFTLKAKATLIHSCIINGLKLSIGFLYPSAMVLIVIAIVNPLINTLLLLFVGKVKVLLLTFSTSGHSVTEKHQAVTLFNWKSLLKKHRDFPLFQSPQALLNALSQASPVVVFATLFGSTAAGFYSFSCAMLAVPIVLLGKAVGDVFFGKIATEVNNQNYVYVKKLFFQSTCILILIGLVPLSVVIFLGPELFSFIFGESWTEAGVYAQWLSLWTFFVLINSPSLKLIITFKKQKQSLIINAITTPLRLTALVVGGYVYQSEIVALFAFVVVGIGHNIAIITLAYRSVNKFCDK